MIWIKLVAPSLLLVIALLTFFLDFHWRDRRTRKHQRARAFLIGVIVLSGAATIVTVIVEHWRSEAAQEKLQNFVTGGLYPQIRMELYLGPKMLEERTLTLSPSDPGITAVIMENVHDFPVYDLSVFMQEASRSRWSTEITTAFNGAKADPDSIGKELPKLLPGKAFNVMLPGRLGEQRLGFDFYVTTRLGRTKHQFRYVLQGDHWEFARRVTDMTTSEVYEETVSPEFPRNEAGQADYFVMD